MAGDDDHISGGTNRKVQARKVRKDGWTAARRRIFLDHLAACANVSRSAEAAGMTVGSAALLRRRDLDFAELWQEALAAGYQRLEAMLLERAAGGVDRTSVAGTTETPDPSKMDTELALSLLRHHRGGVNGKPKTSGPRPRKASTEDLTEALLDKLEALSKRLMKKAG